VAEIDEGQELPLLESGAERIIVPLSGAFVVQHHEAGREFETVLTGRPSVFSGSTDVLYLSAASTARVTGLGRFAVAECPTSEVRLTRHVLASEVPVEIRGTGSSTRQVHNFGTPEVLDAARLIVCEVITPSGNWSSYPPHKHDEYVQGLESRLEEIYYFEANAETADGSHRHDGDAFGSFSAYSSAAGEIEIDTTVRTGDVALVPHGYHGPAAAAPGYNLYYLNVMAGPDVDRAWLITDDPAHEWIRGTWANHDIDPRLPFSLPPTESGAE
jgi:5-deoxy-glucuronate isomerase